MKKAAITLGISAAAAAGCAVLLLVRLSNGPVSVPHEVQVAVDHVPVPQESLPALMDFDDADIDFIVTPLEQSGNSASRLKAVRDLPRKLRPSDTDKLIDHLGKGPNTEIELVIKNDIINVLRDQDIPVIGLTDALIALASDRTQNITVRIYSLQHLRPIYEATSDPAVMDFFHQALEETSSEIAGGALLALSYLGREYQGEVDMARLSEQAAKIAISGSTSKLTRISALQIAREHNAPEIEPFARRIAASEEESLALRLSAIAALKGYRHPESGELLQNLSSQDDVIGRAAALALD